MSRVLRIAADKPLPLCGKQEERTTVIKLPDLEVLGPQQGKEISVTAPGGFLVEEHSYYRHAVDELDLPIKPYSYELHLEVHEKDLADLKAYLEAHFAPGEVVELWNLWVGVDQSGHLPHYRGSLSQFGMETLEQLLHRPLYDSGPGQCRMTITI